MSIATEITRLNNAKAAIKSAIEAKGVTVPSSTKLDGYASLVNSIPSGGGGGTEVELTRPIIYLCNNNIDRDAFGSDPISINDGSYWNPVYPKLTAIATTDPFYDISLANVTVGQSYHVKFESPTNINITGTSEFIGTISNSIEIFDENGDSYLPKRYRIGDLIWNYTDVSPEVPNTVGTILLTVEVGSSTQYYKIYCVNTDRL